MEQQYDIIITGAGASGLLLAMRIAADDELRRKKVLIIDQSSKNTNDRTWCFWEKGKGMLESIVHHSWENVRFASSDLDVDLALKPYSYKMIKGIDFYQYAQSVIDQNENISWVKDQVLSITDTGSQAVVTTTQKTFVTPQLFNSILFSNSFETNEKYPVINQHFVGWFVKSRHPVFNPKTATFMDFTIPQKGNTRFMYVLPTSQTEALFEYTLFSKELLAMSEYEQGIKDYLSSLGIEDYEITETEKGCIPMTCFPFWNENSKHIHHIGMAGGWTKPSTGYTFMNSLKRTNIIIEQLKQNKKTLVTQKKTQFWFYDLLLLDILSKTNQVGAQLFSSMFKTSNVTDIFRFLDEDSSFFKNIQTIWKMPKGIFIKALFNRILNRYP